MSEADKMFKELGYCVDESLINMVELSEEKKYYHRINNLDIALEETNHKYIMIHQWAKDKSHKWHKWGIAVFNYEKDECYWYLRTYGNFTHNDIDWYDFGCLVNLGYKWIEELGWN